MNTRVRRTMKVAPGVRLNLNKSSASVSVGGSGARLTLNSKGKTTTTIGAQGTGAHVLDKGTGPKPQIRGRSTSSVPVQFNGTQHNAGVRAGVRGAGTTRSTKGTRNSVGVPGSGVSAAQEYYPRQPPAPPPQRAQSDDGVLLGLMFCLIIAALTLRFFGVG